MTISTNQATFLFEKIAKLLHGLTGKYFTEQESDEILEKLYELDEPTYKKALAFYYNRKIKDLETLLGISLNKPLR